MKITAWKGGRTERVYARIIPQAKKKLLARIRLEGFATFADWLEAEAERSPTLPAPDGGDSAPSQALSTPDMFSAIEHEPTPAPRR